MSRVLASAPLRVSLAGGGTDLPEWYRERGAHVLAAALTERVRLHVDDRREPASDSPLLELFRRRNGQCPAVTATCKFFGGGLGSSGALAVALVALEATLRGERRSALETGLEAYRWERDLLRRPVGFQDPVTAALGSCVEMRASATGEIVATRREDLFDHLRQIFATSVSFFDIGGRRDAGVVLSNLVAGLGDRSSASSGLATPDEVANAIRAADGAWLGEILHRHWRAKVAMNPSASSATAQQVLELAIAAGATGGKLIGAGGGGVVMVAGPERTRAAVVRACTEAGYAERELTVDRNGVTVASEMRDA